MSEPIARLFCLPYAGGSVAVYHRWARSMPPGLAVHPVELPGHGLRRDEPLLGDFDTLVGWIAQQLLATVTGPYVLFGHSLGALLAFETARAVRDSLGEACALMVSGRNAPSTHRAGGGSLHALPDAELVAATGIWGGLPPELDAFPALRARSLRALRTDLLLAETYRRRPAAPLACPVTVFGGDEDELVDAPGLAAWQSETTGQTTVIIAPGGHLMVHDPRFAAMLGAQLRNILWRLAAPRSAVLPGIVPA